MLFHKTLTCLLVLYSTEMEEGQTTMCQTQGTGLFIQVLDSRSLTGKPFFNHLLGKH